MNPTALIYLPDSDDYVQAEDLEPTYDITSGELTGYLATIEGFQHWAAVRYVHVFSDTYR